MTAHWRLSVACIGLHWPETQAPVVTGYSHLRWPDSPDDRHFNFLYNIICGFGCRARGSKLVCVRFGCDAKMSEIISTAFLERVSALGLFKLKTPTGINVIRHKSKKYKEITGTFRN